MGKFKQDVLRLLDAEATRYWDAAAKWPSELAGPLRRASYALRDAAKKVAALAPPSPAQERQFQEAAMAQAFRANEEAIAAMRGESLPYEDEETQY